MPESKLWPPNEIWDLHIRDNPYDGTEDSFTTQQKKLAELHFGHPIDNLEDFAKLTAIVHGEHIKADVEFHRSREFDCSGALLWMFNDVWPCGSWSIVDYFLTKKTGYYAMKRACRHVSPFITYHDDGYKAFVSNETLIQINGTVKITQQLTNGTNVKIKNYTHVSLPENSCTLISDLSEFDLSIPNSMFFIKISYNNIVLINSFMHHPFSDMDFKAPFVEIVDFIKSTNTYSIKIRSDVIARSVYIKSENADFDDNYFDIPANFEYTVKFTSTKDVKPSDLEILTFTDIWN